MKTRENKNEKKSEKNIFNSESAAATVIAAVLLLSLIFTVLAFVKVAYVPEWKSDAEKLHMDEVQKDMTELKYVADTAASFMALDPDYSFHPYYMTVPISMGGGEVPIFEPSRSSGTISVNTEPYNIIITQDSPILGLPQKIMVNLTLGGITYDLDNTQYVDQTLRYENGALILKQGSTSLMRQSPSFITYETTENDNNIYKISIRAINITGDPEAISSDADVSLKLNGTKLVKYEDYTSRAYIDSFYCKINTRYPEAWESYLQETAEKAKLIRHKDYELNKIDSGIYFNFTPTHGKIIDTFYINETVIDTELGINSLKSKNFNTESGIERQITPAHKISLTKQQKGGMVCSGTYIQFTNKEINNYIEINSVQYYLAKGDIVRLTINGNQISGHANVDNNEIQNFYFDVKMYINGDLKDTGKITGISVTNFSDYKSSLTYKLPAYLSRMKLEADGKTIIDSQSNASISIYNICPSVDGKLDIIFDKGHTNFNNCGAEYEILNN